MGFCSRLAQFKAKFHVRSLFDFAALHVLRQRCETYIHCTLNNYWHGERSELKLVSRTYRGGGNTPCTLASSLALLTTRHPHSPYFFITRHTSTRASPHHLIHACALRYGPPQSAPSLCIGGLAEPCRLRPRALLAFCEAHLSLWVKVQWEDVSRWIERQQNVTCHLSFRFLRSASRTLVAYTGKCSECSFFGIFRPPKPLKRKINYVYL
jgi:hypothetical protein